MALEANNFLDFIQGHLVGIVNVADGGPTHVSTYAGLVLLATAALSVAGFSEAAADQPGLTLVPVVAVQDGVDGSPPLHAPTDIETIAMSGRTYAFVLGNEWRAIQIIDVTDPTAPTPVGMIQDMVSGTDYVQDLEVLVTSGRVYVLAFVGSHSEPTPIVIDVTDPTKPAKLTVEYIPELDYSWGDSHSGEVFEKNGRSFVIIVGGYYGGGIRTFDFTDPTKPTFVSDWNEHGELYFGIGGADGIDVVDLSGRTYAFPHDKFGIVDIDNPSTPTVAATPNWPLQDRLGYIGAHNLAIVDWSGRTYAVAFTNTGSLHTVDVTAPTRPVLVSSIYEDSEGFGDLLPAGPVETFHMSGRTYVLMPIQGFVGENRAIQIVDITNPTLPAPAGIVPYERTKDINIVEAGGHVYALILGRQLPEHGWEYVNVMEIVATGSAPHHTMSISDLRIVDTAGHETRASAGNQIQLAADLSSYKRVEQHFTFLVQIQDANGMVVDLSWTAGSIGFGGTISLAAGFTPTEPNTYKATAFAWRSLDDPTPLAAPVSLNFTVY